MIIRRFRERGNGQPNLKELPGKGDIVLIRIAIEVVQMLTGPVEASYIQFPSESSD